MILLKKSKKKSVTLLILLTGSFTFSSNSITEWQKKNNNPNTHSKVKPTKFSTNNHLKPIKINSNINLIKHNFNKVNPNINLDFSKQFNKVLDFYKLSTNKNLLISQILIESKGKHRTENGEVLIGSSGEVGISQIKPSTALFFIKNIMSEKEKQNIQKLGADNISNLETEQDVLEWLKIKKNNIVIWGYIMKYNIKRTKGNIADGLVAYNAGFGGLNKFKKNGHNSKEHSYYKKIEKLSQEF